MYLQSPNNMEIHNDTFSYFLAIDKSKCVKIANYLTVTPLVNPLKKQNKQTNNKSGCPVTTFIYGKCYPFLGQISRQYIKWGKQKVSEYLLGLVLTK